MAVYDERLRLFAVNDAMADVIGLPEALIQGLRISEIGGKEESEKLETHLRDVLVSGIGRDVETYLRAGGEYNAHAWLARIAPLTDSGGKVVGVCPAAHDFSEHYLARERLRLVNEAGVRIGTSLDVTRTAQELADVCVPVLADFVSVDLLDAPEHGGEPRVGPPPTPVALRRVAHRSVHPGTPEAVLKPGQVDVYPAASAQADSLRAGRTIVVPDDTATLTEWLSWDAPRGERAAEYGVHAVMCVPITARGQTLGVAVLARCRRPDPFTADDVLLAEEVTARAAVCIDNARRYSRERETALSLQRSLLPRKLPRTAALEAASRCLPAARAGVGGDWFDVIPLSGLRVAGCGWRWSSAAASRPQRPWAGCARPSGHSPTSTSPRTNCSPTWTTSSYGCPRRPARRTPRPKSAPPACTWCTTRSHGAALARAGHPPPVMLPPGGPARQVDVPAGPPLGLGGLPFESVELSLPEGTVLALYTDGLLDDRDRDPAVNLDLLCAVLEQSADSLDGACHAILQALLPAGGAPDDVALLLARTHGLPSSRVATWNVPADPALVAPIRGQVVEQLDSWELSRAAFTAELVVSELVTNAIRYGDAPIGLRLIHDADTLIC